MGVKELTEITNRYGANKDFVLAGGGHTSLNDGPVMYVKPSGTTMADIKSNDFVRMDLHKLSAMMTRKYPEESDDREAAALKDMMDARVPGEEKRPSVETLLHALLPYRYVVHTHPALVNGLTCSVGGETIMEELFGREALWIPVVNPGYILALTIQEKLDQHRAAGGGDQIIFLQNHGVFIQADTLEEIDKLYSKITTALTKKIERFPSVGYTENLKISGEQLAAMLPDNRNWNTAPASNSDIAAYLADQAAFTPLELSFTPNHIVYSGFKPLFCGKLEDLPAAFSRFVEENGVEPKVIALSETGIYGIGETVKTAGLARELFLDGVKVAVYTESFGGYQFMPQDKIDFIRNWEVEQYRSKVSGG